MTATPDPQKPNSPKPSANPPNLQTTTTSLNELYVESIFNQPLQHISLLISEELPRRIQEVSSEYHITHDGRMEHYCRLYLSTNNNRLSDNAFYYQYRPDRSWQLIVLPYYATRDCMPSSFPLESRMMPLISFRAQHYNPKQPTLLRTFLRNLVAVTQLDLHPADRETLFYNAVFGYAPTKIVRDVHSVLRTMEFFRDGPVYTVVPATTAPDYNESALLAARLDQRTQHQVNIRRQWLQTLAKGSLYVATPVRHTTSIRDRTPIVGYLGGLHVIRRDILNAKTDTPIKEFMITSMAIEPDFQRQGIGSQLLSRLIHLPRVTVYLPLGHVALPFFGRFAVKSNLMNDDVIRLVLGTKQSAKRS